MSFGTLKITIEAKDSFGTNIKVVKVIDIPDSKNNTNPFLKDADEKVAKGIKVMIHPLLESWFADTKI